MNTFGTLFDSLSPSDKAQVARVAGTSVSFLRHVAHGRKRISLGMADALVAAITVVSRQRWGGLTYVPGRGFAGEGSPIFVEDMPLSEGAARQHALRVDPTAALAA